MRLKAGFKVPPGDLGVDLLAKLACGNEEPGGGIEI